MARILHIEDDPRNRLLVRKLLSGDGHDVVDAVDGLEGVRLALTCRPDLVLVDLNLPGLDGYEVTLRLRTEAGLRAVPIVAITAEGDRDTSLAVGCDGFLQKPIDARYFAQQVAGFLAGHREPPSASTAESGDRLREQGGRIAARLEQKVAELVATNERLREVERLRTEFYRNVSHELATPLTPIVGYLKMLVDEELGELKKPQQKALRAMDESVRRLRNVLDSLVDVTGLETGRMRFYQRDYDFLEVVVGVIGEVRERASERRITLVTHLPSGPLPGRGDSERLRRAAAQLLDNACKFTPEGGTIAVAVESREGAYVLTVADSGPGISLDQRERVFEPFYQVDGSPTRAHGGVGVGLAIARRVARGLGGDLVVRPSVAVDGKLLGGAVLELRVQMRAPNESRA